MVVPYYFGSKDGLIDAIFERRIEWLEERRKQGIDAATLEGELDLRTALDLLYRPIAEIELDGERVYARFLLQFLLQFDSWEGKQHPIERRSEEHTSELQSLMRISYSVFCLKKKKIKHHNTSHNT